MDRSREHIYNARDRVESLDYGIKDLLNVIDIIYLGIENNTNDGKDSEMSCMNIIGKSLSDLYETEISELRTILDKLADEQVTT